MRIAQVSPLYESVPPRLYGGTERVVSWLTDELVRLGHEVTLYASGDSTTRARLVPISRRSLRLDETCVDELAHHMVEVDQVLNDAPGFDFIHWHIGYVQFPASRRIRTPQVTTLHGRLDIPDLVPLYQHFIDVPVISISDSQRKPLPWLNWRGTVHHGLPINLHKFHGRTGQYLAFLGRISPEKGVDRAIEIARRVGMELKIAAKVSKADQEYFDQVIRPLLKGPLTEYYGEIGEAEKDDFLGNAYAVLFPINWPEPFGLVMIEAMACGTPVIAFPGGSVGEVMQDGVTGYVVDGVEGAVQAIERIPTLSRRRCRQAFEERFTSTRMARDYVAIYEEIMEEKAASIALQRGTAAASRLWNGRTPQGSPSRPTAHFPRPPTTPPGEG